MEECAAADACGFKCTYALSISRRAGATSAPNLIHQPIYVCQTCNDPNDPATANKCCCAGCAATCHDGHEVDFIAYGNAYCDCGAAGDGGCCQLINESIAAAEELLGSRGVAFDEDGRIAGTQDSKLAIYKFRQFGVIGDEESAPILCDQAVSLSKLSKDTFWIGAAEEPRTHMESIARTIFRHHTEGSTFDTASSGAEFWVQVKPTNHVSGDSDVGVDLHYDKDEEVAALFGIGIFPQISTVTYLSYSTNIPTVIFDNTAADTVGAPIRMCWLSYPHIGKHVAFDGRLLHGAPKELAYFSMFEDRHQYESCGVGVSSFVQSDSGRDNYRVTFLVNVWLNHHPAGVSPLPLEFVSSLNGFNGGLFALKLPFGILDDTFTEERRLRVSPEDIDVYEAAELKPEKCVLDIPFVTDKSQWGKAAGEAAIFLRMPLCRSLVDTIAEWNSDQGRYGNNMRSASVEYQGLGRDNSLRLYYEDEDEDELVWSDVEEMDEDD